jgi:exosortase
LSSKDEREQPVYLGMSQQTWMQIGIVTALFVAVFWPNLRRLWWKTNPFTGEANWGHAIVVPVIGIYYLFIHREELIKARGDQFIWGAFTRPGRLFASLGLIAFGALVILACNGRTGTIFSLMRVAAWAVGFLGGMVLLLDWSIGTTLFGLGVYVYGIYPGQNDYIKDMGMITTLFGVVLMIYGWRVMRIAWFPIVFLICAIPWPGLVYSWVAEPLQQLAANVAVLVLKSTGVEALCSGTKIIIQSAGPLKPARILNVAEACAGMRSLMTFITVGGAVAFLSPRALWQRIIIVISAIPIAIFCNVMRISGQGLLDHYVSPEWSESFAHQFVGMVMLLPAFFLILGVAYAVDKIFIEEADDTPPPPVLSRRATAAVATVPVTPAKRVAPIAASPAETKKAGANPTQVKPTVPTVPTVVAGPPVSSPGSSVVPSPLVGAPATGANAVPPPSRPNKPGMVVPPRPRNLTSPVPPRAIVPPRPVTPANPPKEQPK